MPVWFEKYGKTRYWGVYEDNTLVCITLYRKGAKEVVRRLTALDHLRRKFDTLRLVADMVEEIQLVADK